MVNSVTELTCFPNYAANSLMSWNIIYDDRPIRSALCHSAGVDSEIHIALMRSRSSGDHPAFASGCAEMLSILSIGARARSMISRLSSTRGPRLAMQS